MLVSFIIIAYNAEKFLDKSLESLKKQDYPHSYALVSMGRETVKMEPPPWFSS